jgi:hypothetical protein
LLAAGAIAAWRSGRHLAALAPLDHRDTAPLLAAAHALGAIDAAVVSVAPLRSA